VRRRRRSTTYVAAVALACAACASSLGAQESGGTTSAGVSTGSRVRLATPEAAPFVGTLVRSGADTLVVELPSGASLALPQGRITRLDVSGGIRRRTGQGAGIGFLAGAGVGTVVGLATYRRSDCGDSAIGRGVFCPWLDGVSREATVIVDAALVGAAGTIVGALIGHVGRETWIPVSVGRVGAGGPRLTVGRVARATGIGVALDF
jgi:hypothetical protein